MAVAWVVVEVFAGVEVRAELLVEVLEGLLVEAVVGFEFLGGDGLTRDWLLD